MSVNGRYSQLGSNGSTMAANKSIDLKASQGNPYSERTNNSSKFNKSVSLKDNEQIQSPEEISNKMESIRKLGLLGGLQLKQVKYDGHIRIPTVHNDYHQSSSNPGYSRKPDGGIYPK